MSLTSEYEYSVIIVGGGMVGLSCALALSQAKFTVTLIEANKDFSPILPSPQDLFDTRVVAITRASERFLQHCGVWDTIRNTRACAYQSMKVWDSVADGMIQFWADDFLEPDLGHIVEQQVITGALWLPLQQYPVTIKTESVVALQQTPRGVEVSLQSGEKITAALVIGADGAESTLRSLCNISTKGWEYGQQAIVATVKGEKSHEKTAFQRFMPEGPLALLPLSSSDYASIVWTCPPSKAQMLMEASSLTFEEILSRESEEVMGKMTLISERKCFPLKMHHVKNYVKAGCVLVGDAAHTLHPLAGQGVNLGFLDVAVLVTQLIEARKQGQACNERTSLSRYERQRRYHNQAMIWAMELFKRGFSSTSPIVQQLRNQGLNWVDNFTPLKRCFAQIALGNWGPMPSILHKEKES